MPGAVTARSSWVNSPDRLPRSSSARNDRGPLLTIYRPSFPFRMLPEMRAIVFLYTFILSEAAESSVTSLSANLAQASSTLGCGSRHSSDSGGGVKGKWFTDSDNCVYMQSKNLLII